MNQTRFLKTQAWLLLAMCLANPAWAAIPEAWIWPAAYPKNSGFQGNSYVLQLHIPKSGKPESRGPAPWAWPVKELHLVFRLERRPEMGQILQEYLKLKYAWASRGTKVHGLQLDYDSPTAKLGLYMADLRSLRERLPPPDALSITGLADWMRIRDLEGQIDPSITIFFQMYRETQAHLEADKYIDGLTRLKTNFKIGLLPKQTLTTAQMDRLEKTRFFKGLVTFYGRAQ